jgi:TonB family protein
MLISISLMFASLLMAHSGWQGNSSILEKSLQDQFLGKLLTLRHFYVASKLQFNADGKLLGNANEGSWTTYGRVKVTQIKVNGQKLALKARRLVLQYDPQGMSFFNIGERAVQNCTMEVSLTSGADRVNRLSLALTRIFLTQSENLAEVAPDSWKLFLSRMSPPTKADLAAAMSKETMGYIVHTKEESRITEPITLHSSLPRYTDHARLARASGKIVIAAVIDTSGRAISPIIVVPMGLGLDEAAIEELAKWTFKPAQLNGDSVALLTNIEVTFQLYDQPPSIKKQMSQGALQ